MKFGTLYSYWGSEWRCDYPDVARRVAEIGFDILEVGAGHLVEMTDAQLGDLKAAADTYGLVLTSNIGPARDKDIASRDPRIRADGVKYLTDILRAMDKINSRSLVGAMYSYWPCAFDDVDKEGALERSAAEMKKIGAVAEELGIECCLEILNRYETYMLTDCQEGLDYCKRVGCKSVNLLLDTFHMNIEEDNIPEAIRLAGDMLGHLHVGEGNRKLPGMGSLPWKDIGRALKSINYQKGVVMEPFLLEGGKVGADIKVWRDLSGGADTAQLDRYIRDSLKFIRHEFA